MERQELEIGVLSAGERSGAVRSIRKVAFAGEPVTGFVVVDRDEGNTRGVYERLYRLPDGRYRLYREAWSRWVGETTTARLSGPLTEAELHDERHEWAPSPATLEEAGLLPVVDLDALTPEEAEL